jgi:hypothetical protein
MRVEREDFMSSDRLTFRAARMRAASALLAYLDVRSVENEAALLEATHDLEAVVLRRRLACVSQRARARQLAHVAALR